MSCSTAAIRQGRLLCRTYSMRAGVLGRSSFTSVATASTPILLPSRHTRPPSVSLLCRSFASYEPMTKEEEKAEQDRVKSLTPFEKEMELRELDRQLAKLHMLRGIHTGELYTLRGKFKMLARDYGIPFMMWYWAVWSTTALLCYAAIELGGVDAIAILAKVDGWTGYELSTKVDPTLGTIGLTIAVNELIEPIRLPIVVFTTKPVVDAIYPPRY